MTKSSVFSAAPGVLVAMPQLLEQSFHRSVVVMLEHNEDGALANYSYTDSSTTTRKIIA